MTRSLCSLHSHHMGTKTRRITLSAWALAAGMTLGAGAAAEDGAAPLLRINGQPPPQNQCNSQAAQFLIGQPFDGKATLTQALAATGAKAVLMLRPDSILTKEYVRDRLNVEVDASNRIISVRCG